MNDTATVFKVLWIQDGELLDSFLANEKTKEQWKEITPEFVQVFH